MGGSPYAGTLHPPSPPPPPCLPPPSPPSPLSFSPACASATLKNHDCLHAGTLPEIDPSEDPDRAPAPSPSSSSSSSSTAGAAAFADGPLDATDDDTAEPKAENASDVITPAAGFQRNLDEAEKRKREAEEEEEWSPTPKKRKVGICIMSLLIDAPYQDFGWSFGYTQTKNLSSIPDWQQIERLEHLSKIDFWDFDPFCIVSYSPL